jgi:hypothetical protein
MMTQHPLVADYLARLASAAEGLPAQEARELISDITDHLDVGLNATSTPADVRNLLDRLGHPEELVSTLGAAPVSPRSWDGRAALIASVGLVGFVAAEFAHANLRLALTLWVIGIVATWVTPLWSARQRIVATVVHGSGLGLAWVCYHVALRYIRANSDCARQTIDAFQDVRARIEQITALCGPDMTGFNRAYLGLGGLLLLIQIATAVWLLQSFRTEGRKS